MKRKIRLILIGEKNGISLHFLESPEFFFMSLQIFLYQRLAGLYEELSTIQIKGGNIWNTSRDMMIYICINIFICAEQLIKPRLYLKF